MKNKIALLAALLISSGVFAQKDELKTLKKIYDKDTPSEKDITEYKAAVTKAEGYLASASPEDKVLINYFSSQAPILEVNVMMQKPENQKNPQIALKLFNPERIHKLAVAYSDMRDYEKKAGKSVYTKDIDQDVATFGPTLLNYAIGLGSQKKYSDGAKVLYDIYLMDKKNADNLYYAASYAVNGQDYDTALKYYTELKDLNYSGEGTQYYASSIATGKEEPFNSKADRDKMVALKAYIKPREEKMPSKRGEIYKNIALILVQKGQNDQAKAAFADAIKENPDDISLLTNEANLYLQLKDYQGYKSKVESIIARNPNDADLIYNLGVVSLDGKQPVEAEKYFKRVLEINPKYANAYLNLAAIKLDGDEKVVAEMNKLGSSEKDNKRYEVLKKQRTETFTAAKPFLEKAYELDPDNEAVIDNLFSVYNFLEMTDTQGFKDLKAKRKAIKEAAGN
ncbi:MAG: tetratricopeptide repeat protein [Flavobacterium sp.]|nr:MAG: tetratricopeptide repeat protein [Flavobacterium sp.]